MEERSTIVPYTVVEHARINLPVQIFVGFLIAVIVVSGAIGNFVVMFAIASQRKLHSRANFLIASLAMADFLVSILVTPFFAFMTMHDGRFDSWWIPEKITCQVFVFLDVTCCTSSIYHLCAIAWVRYRTVSTISVRLYTRRFKDVLPTIGAVWLTAALLSFAPYLIFLKRDNEVENSGFNINRTEAQIGEINVESTDVFLSAHNRSNLTEDSFYITNDMDYSSHLACTVNSNKAYRVIATTMAFYGPLFVIVVIYIKMAGVAWSRIKTKPGGCARPAHSNNSEPSDSNTNPSEANVRRFQTTNFIRTAVTNAYRNRLKFSNKNAQTCHCESKYAINSEYNMQSAIQCPHNDHNLENSFLIDGKLGDNVPSGEGCEGGDDKCYESIVTQNSCFEANKNSHSTPTTVLHSTLSRSATSVIPEKQYNDLRAKYGILKCSSETNLNKIHSTTPYVVNSIDTISQKSKVSIGEEDIPEQKRPSTCSPQFGLASIKRSLSIKLRRERRVIKTLGMVIGAFIVCWLPFFLKELILPFCTSCSISTPAETIINWMGYVNSALNPFIYAFSNSEFYLAFRRVFNRSQMTGRFFTSPTTI